MPTRITSRPTPTGYQHWLEVWLRRAPDPRFTDPLRALEDLEDGLAQPVVEVIEEQADGSVVVQVSLFSEDPVPTADDAAAMSGLSEELTSGDRL